MLAENGIDQDVFRKDLWERVLWTFNKVFLATAAPLWAAHQAGLMEDFASGNWSAVKSVAVAVAVPAAAAGARAAWGLICRGAGVDPSSASLRAAAANGNGNSVS